MTPRRKLSPGTWVAFGALGVAGTLLVLHLVTGLAYPVLGLVSTVITLLTTSWLFWMLWKQQNPLARQPDERDSDSSPRPPGERP